MTGPESSHILEKYFSNICISKQVWLGALETGISGTSRSKNKRKKKEKERKRKTTKKEQEKKEKTNRKK